MELNPAHATLGAMAGARPHPVMPSLSKRLTIARLDALADRLELEAGAAGGGDGRQRCVDCGP
jgi:hypothetical protein